MAAMAMARASGGAGVGELAKRRISARQAAMKAAAQMVIDEAKGSKKAGRCGGEGGCGGGGASGAKHDDTSEEAERSSGKIGVGSEDAAQAMEHTVRVSCVLVRRDSRQRGLKGSYRKNNYLNRRLN